MEHLSFLNEDLESGKGSFVKSIEEGVDRVLKEGKYERGITTSLLCTLSGVTQRPKHPVSRYSAKLQTLFCLPENTFFIVDESEAEKLVLGDFKARFKEDRAQSQREGCRLSFPKGYMFGTLPHGLLLRKDSPNLKNALNSMWVY